MKLEIYYYANEKGFMSGIPVLASFQISSLDEIKEILELIQNLAYEGRITAWYVTKN